MKKTKFNSPMERMAYLHGRLDMMIEINDRIRKHLIAIEKQVNKKAKA